MNKARTILCGLCITVSSFAMSGQTYLDKFQAYMKWNEHLPTYPDPKFLAFIAIPTPLTQKLREKWLYQLARNNDWATFTQYYTGSADSTLQCYAQMALYEQGKIKEAFSLAKTSWLNGSSQPKACDEVFNLMLKNTLDEHLITERIALALDNRKIGLAGYLLKQYKHPRLKDAQTLLAIQQNPDHVLHLEPGNLHDEFYLYGLKRMVSRNIKKAIHIWKSSTTRNLLNEGQQQAFLAHVALYKAMRNEKDSPYWFAKVKPTFYNTILLEWQLRFALVHQNWKQVEHLVNQSKEKDEPSYQYWLARALDAQGKKENAIDVYQHLAQKRNYYGFLASLQLKKNFSFENEPITNNMQLLKSYKMVTDHIKTLYTSKQNLQASRLLTDFISELPKDEKSALIHWVANDLNWHGKSVYLSNTDELKNQLSLRFPLAYRKIIKEHAKRYQIPEALIYAIIRQESTFRNDIVSPAGATGLMQILPSTAKIIAKRANIPYTDKKQLFLYQKNITIGVAYLEALARRFNRHTLLMLAAYNAGPKQVEYWLKNHPPKDVDIWIETLPWRETRNYLKNIIAFYAVYQYRMQEKPSLRLFMKPVM